MGIKNQENQQFARVSEDSGNRSYTQTQNEGSEPLCDNNGRLIVRMAGGGGFVPGDTEALHYVQSGYVETGTIGVDPTPARLMLISGFNISGILKFLQLFDGAATILPGATPLVSIAVPPNGNSFSYSPFSGMSFPTVIAFASSTTGDVYTASGSNDFWINADYYLL